jgi:hypothetical protein
MLRGRLPYFSEFLFNLLGNLPPTRTLGTPDALPDELQ